MNLEFKKCLMMSGYTIEGVIRRENSHDMDKNVVKLLVEEYNKANNYKIPKVGDIVLIPVIKKGQ
jgi:hypothetical protein